MGRNKLNKFADMATYPNVYQFPYHVLVAEGCPLRGLWKEKVFANSNPIVLELGCGRGEYVVALGRKNPMVNYIGVDIKGARMWTGATQAVAENLRNVAFLRAEIENIDKLFAPDEVDSLWLTFSDPQMKKASKRLTSTYFLERYRRFLKDGGTVNVKTDSNFLFTYTYHVACENDLPLLACSNNIYAYKDLSSDIIGVQTYYEQQWLARGITIKFVSFALTHSGVLREPDIEIPLDTYRSYNRDKRSSLTFSK